MNNLLPLVFMVSLGFFMANAANLVPDTCKKISQSDPNVKYNFCVATLGSDPQSATADLADLGLISLQLDIAKAKSISATIDRLKKDPKLDPFVKSVLDTCLEVYSDAPADLEDAINALKAKDNATANVKISGAMNAGTTCEDGFKEQEGAVSPLTKENNDYFQMTAISLGFTV